MSHILIVGQKFSTLTDYILENGHEYTLVQDILKTRFPDKRFKRRILGDFTNRETVIDSLQTLKSPVDGVIATYENYVLPAAWIAAHLGLPGIPVASAEACTDKYKMRSLFAATPEKISPGFSTVPDELSLRSFAETHSFPLILKPANLSKSLLVTKNDSMDELLANYHRSVELLETTYRKYAPNRTPSLIVEEYLEGSIHSVDAFIDSEGRPHILENIVDYRTGYDIGFNDNFHYSRLIPSELTSSDQTALRHCADIGIRALGMKSTPAHVEIIMTRKGPRIVEIGARNGGYRERMHSLANGIDITANAIALTLGNQPDIHPKKDEPCAVIELFPKKLGKFVGIDHETELRALPSLKYLSIKARKGQLVGKAADGHKMCAVVVLHNSDTAQFNQDLSYIDDFISVIIE